MTVIIAKNLRRNTVHVDMDGNEIDPVTKQIIKTEDKTNYAKLHFDKLAKEQAEKEAKLREEQNNG